MSAVFGVEPVSATHRLAVDVALAELALELRVDRVVRDLDVEVRVAERTDQIVERHAAVLEHDLAARDRRCRDRDRAASETHASVPFAAPSGPGANAVNGAMSSLVASNVPSSVASRSGRPWAVTCTEAVADS